MKKINNKIQFLNKHYQFRYNRVNNKIEFKNVNENDFKPLDDRIINSIVVLMIQSGIEINVNELRILINSDIMPEYNPLKEYFDDLPVIKSTSNIDKLCSTIKTHDDDFFKWSFTKWLVSWVACMYYDDIVNHQCVILAGKQGIGKSTWVKNLMPIQLSPYYYSGNIKLGNKDTLSLLSDKCLINLDELASMTYSNVTELKELVTKNDITFRKPYGYFTETFTRRASFIGSVNGSEFLYDLTGNRRFLSFEVMDIENYGNHSVDMNLVLSEAFNLYKNGFQYWFDAKDQERVEKNNENFMVLSVEEIEIRKFYCPIPLKEYNKDIYTSYFYVKQNKKESDRQYSLRQAARMQILERCNQPKYMKVSDIFKKISYKNVATQGDLVKLGKILNRLGFERRRLSSGVEYKVYDIKPDFSTLKDEMENM